jgi:hypothetical protein
MKLVGKILLILGALIIIGVIIYLNIVHPNPMGVLLFGIISAVVGFITIIIDDVS